MAGCLSAIYALQARASRGFVISNPCQPIPQFSYGQCLSGEASLLGAVGKAGNLDKRPHLPLANATDVQVSPCTAMAVYGWRTSLPHEIGQSGLLLFRGIQGEGALPRRALRVRVARPAPPLCWPGSGRSRLPEERCGSSR